MRYLFAIFVLLIPVPTLAGTGCWTYQKTGFAIVSSDEGQNGSCGSLPMRDDCGQADVYGGDPSSNNYYCVPLSQSQYWYVYGHCTGTWHQDADCDGVKDSADQCPGTTTTASNGATTDYSTDDGCPDAPVEPANCSDGTKSGDEDGVDCGGGCFTECTSYCPDGTVSRCDAFDDCACVYETNTDQFGNCPHNYVKAALIAGGDTCISFPEDETPILAKDQQLADNAVSYTEPVGWTVPTGSTSTSSTVSEVDNGNGTVTRTTTTTGSSSGSPSGSVGTGGSPPAEWVTTKTEVINTTTNKVISETIVTSGQGDPEANSENYNLAIPSFGETTFDAVIEAPVENPIASKIAEIALQHPVAALVETLAVTETDGVCSIAIEEEQLHGIPFNLTFDLCPWESTLRTLGAVFLVICQAYGILIIMGRDKKGDK